MSPGDRLSYLAGQISAMEATLRALIRTHPEPLALLEAFEQSVQSQTAMTTPAPVPETYIQGQEAEYASVRAMLAAAKGP